MKTQPKRLVICLDGTWNNAERDVAVVDGRKLYKPTNVLKAARAIRPADDNSEPQITYYAEGVGSFVGEPTRFGRAEVFFDRLLGGAFGGGFDSHVKDAYRFLVLNYAPGDEIFVFGFSRGAAEAQSLVRFIEWTGGLLEKDDEYYVVHLYDRYRSTGAAPGGGPREIEAIRASSTGGGAHLKDARPVRVKFLGVFDTVLALGSRFLADWRERDIPTVAPKFAFHVGLVPPSIVDNARQALALDEHRWDFRPVIWRRPAFPKQSLEQRWFPGVHSNVGGGYTHDGLANGALQWMLGEAKKADLAVNWDFLTWYHANIRGDRPESRTAFYKIGEVVRFRWGRGVRALDLPPEAGMSLDPSVGDLIVSDNKYRPQNLLRYLASDANRLQAFPPAQQVSIRALLPPSRP